MMMNEMPENEKQSWPAHFLPLAEQGDVDAQISLGWEYAAGRMVKPDLNESERWFRIASVSVGEKAFFYLIKAMLIERSDRIEAIFKERTSWKIGAIYLLYGKYKVLIEGNRREAVMAFRLGWSKGNIISGIWYLRYRFGIVGAVVFFPYVLYLIFSMLILKGCNKDDERVLE